MQQGIKEGVVHSFQFSIFLRHPFPKTVAIDET